MTQKSEQELDSPSNSAAPLPFYDLLVFAKLLLPPVIGFGVLAIILRYMIEG